MRGTLTVAVSIGLLAGTAQAAPISWSAPQPIAADSDVNTVGVLTYAYNFNEGATPRTINGVTFAGYDSGFVGAPATTSNADITIFSPAFLGSLNVFGSTSPPFTTLSSAYQGLVGTAIFCGNDNPFATLTLKNLTPGLPYIVQLWTNDSRFGGRVQTYTAVNSSLPASSNLLASDGGLGTHVIGSFIADAPTLVIDIAANASVQLNALQVRLIPEPASLSLLGLSALALRRRNRA